MIEALREFAIKLSAVVDNKSFDDVTDKVDEAASSISDFASTAITALTAGAFAVAIKETVDRFNALSDAASRMGGVTATELDRIGYVAGRTGSDAETAAESFEELSKMVGEAAIGVGGGVGFFEDYGLQAKKADGTVKTATEVFEELKAKSKDWTEAQKSAMLQQAGMDKSLVGMLSADTDLIAQEYDKRTQALGINADEVGAMSADFNDHLGRMNRSFQDVLTAVIVRILPPITDAFKTVTKWITYSGDTIVKIIDPFTFVIRTMVRLVGGAIETITSLINVFGAMPAWIALAAVALKGFNAIMRVSPFARMVTLISAVISIIGLLIDDFKVAREGGISFFKFWNEPWVDNFLKAGQSVLDFFDNLGNAILGFGGTIAGLLVGIFTGDFSDLEKYSKKFFDSLIGLLSSFSSVFWNSWHGLAGGLEKIFKELFPDAHELLSGLGASFSRALEAITDAVIDWATSIPAAISNAFAGVVELILSPFTVAKNALTSLFEDFIPSLDIEKKVTGALEKPLKLLSGFKDKISGFFGFGEDDEKQLEKTSVKEQEPEQTTQKTETDSDVYAKSQRDFEEREKKLNAIRRSIAKGTHSVDVSDNIGEESKRFSDFKSSLSDSSVDVSVADNFKSISDRFSDFKSSLSDSSVDVSVADNFKSISDRFSDFKSSLSDSLLFVSISENFKSITDRFTTFKDALSDSSFTLTVKENFESVVNKAKSFGDSVSSEFASMREKASDVFSGAFDKAIYVVQGFVASATESISSIVLPFDEIRQASLAVFDDVSEKVGGLVVSAGKAVSETFGEVLSFVGDLIEQGIDLCMKAIADLVTTITDSISSAFSGISKLLGFGSEDITGDKSKQESEANERGSGFFDFLKFEKGDDVKASVKDDSIQAVTPTSYTTNSVTNVQNSVAQTFNVSNRETAAHLARNATPRFAGGAV